MNLQAYHIKSNNELARQIVTDESQIDRNSFEQLKNRFKIKKNAKMQNIERFTKQQNRQQQNDKLHRMNITQSPQTMFSQLYPTQKSPDITNNDDFSTQKAWNRKINNVNNQMQLMNVISEIKLKLDASSKYKSNLKHEDILKLKELRKYFKQDYIQTYLDVLFALIDDMVYIKNELFLDHQRSLQKNMSEQLYCYIFDNCDIKFLTNDFMVNKLLKVVDEYDRRMETIGQKHEQQLDDMKYSMNSLTTKVQSQNRQILQYQKTLDEQEKQMEELNKFRSFSQAEVQIQELKDRIEMLQSDLKKKDEAIQEDYLHMQQQIQINKSLEEQIAYMQEHLEDQKTAINDLNHKIAQDEKNKDSFKNKVQSIQYFLESLLMKTRSITEVFESVQKEKEQIMNEKQQLLMRASVGYEELTPRPSLEKICKSNNIDSKTILDPSLLNIAQDNGKKKIQVINYKKPRISTINIFKKLVLEIDNKNRNQQKQSQEIMELKKRMESRSSIFESRNSIASPNSNRKRQTKTQKNAGQTYNKEFSIQLQDGKNQQKVEDETDQQKLSKKNKGLIKNFDDHQEELENDIEKQEFYQKTEKIIKDIKNTQQQLKDMQ